MQPGSNVAAIADEIFGSAVGGTDQVNLHSQYLACSHGKLDFQPSTNDGGSPTSATPSTVTDIVNGVVEVTIDSVDCSAAPGTGCDYALFNAVNTALEAAFGTPAYNIADHVIHCMPPNVMNGIAYAYMNSWVSSTSLLLRIACWFHCT